MAVLLASYQVSHVANVYQSDVNGMEIQIFE